MRLTSGRLLPTRRKKDGQRVITVVNPMEIIFSSGLNYM